jgi:hypothetical protein
MTMFGHRACWFCLAPEGAKLKIDKRGNPYLSCAVCGVFAFLRTPTAFASLNMMQTHADYLSDALSHPEHSGHSDVAARVRDCKRELIAARSGGHISLSENAHAAVESKSLLPDLKLALGGGR